MPYMEQITIAGPVREVRKYHSSRYPGRRMERVPKSEETSEPQKIINRRNAKRNLYWKILANFVREDIRIDLTYAGTAPDIEDANRNLTNFINRLKRLYKRKGRQLKWIAVTEYDGHRVHHHLLINNVGIFRAEINEIWPFCNIRYNAFRFYDGGEEDAARVASYLIKETNNTYKKKGAVQKTRYRCSRNLKKPKIIKKVIHSKTWTDRPKAIKGYYIQQPVEYGHMGDGYPYQVYRMIREEAVENVSDP